MNKTKFCAGVSDISDSYMGFILDLWGVLHNGKKAFDDVPYALKELSARGKTVILLSNAAIDAKDMKARLKKMGITPTMYSKIITAGQYLRDLLSNEESGFGKKYYLISPEDNYPIINDLDLERVDDIKEADFLVIVGLPKGQYLDDVTPILRKGVQRHLKAVCLNPDSLSLLGAAYLGGPNAIASKYKDFGGIVEYIGKPYKPIYKACVDFLQENDIFPGDTVMVGDTMAHDILGASLAGMDTCLVRTGIHAAAFKNCQGPADVDRALNILSTQYNNLRPKYLLENFKWGKALPDRKHKRRRKLL
ncbi:MAG: TIGR01459 family HAD-type hydrolase [Pseudomonadota bacterium]|jgi:HAD superfamily hydrolase (TIGR01459 family)|nr:TIGR01459 family HAD-type hydrolase [Alphaproteobacteria bacterium]MEC7703601.1 TIGR01459 family HAD-type hydrolase [Pseudomonadota bacterium]|tara:strand:- start:291 stop:1208 length:918 start_codon:yes stop_codon:yes gene_type:complete